MQTLNLVRKGDLPFDAEVAKLSYQCLTCKACTEQCDHGNVIPPILHEVRLQAVKEGLAPPEISGFLAKFHRNNNPFAKDLLTKLKDYVDAKYMQMESPVAYFASCTTIAKAPEIVKDTFELFEKLKIDFVSLYPEAIQCCGYPLLAAGMEEEFVDVAEINFHAMKKYKTIISGSPTCTYTLKETYKKYAFDLPGKVITINQFLEPFLHNINYKIKKNIRTKLIYHDPCYLSRYLGEVELPRELISQVSGYHPQEFHHKGKESGCSGQGGCYSILNKETSDKIAKEHLQEVSDRNIGMLVTQCPSCIHKFRKNSKRLVVKDTISYLNDCIEGVKD